VLLRPSLDLGIRREGGGSGKDEREYALNFDVDQSLPQLRVCRFGWPMGRGMLLFYFTLFVCNLFLCNLFY
jgi:hypothetical protein